MNKIIGWIFGRLNGWKSIVGYAITKGVSALVALYPDLPAQELTTVLEYIGEILLAIGIAHKVVKPKN